MATKIVCHFLELELLHGFVLCLVQRKNPTLVLCWLVFGVIMILKTYIFYILGFQLIFQFCSFWLLSKYGKIVIQLKCYLLGMLTGPEKIGGRIVFHFWNKIQDGRRITCYSQELELLHRFVRRMQLTLDICWLHFGVILTSHFYVVYIKILVTVLYFSIINVFWLLNLCGAGGDAISAPQANLALTFIYGDSLDSWGDSRHAP